MDFYFPIGYGEQYFGLSLCVIQRGSRIFVTNSVEAWKFIATAKEKAPETLSGRLARALPPGTLPEKTSSSLLMRGDSMVDQVRLYFDVLVPNLAQFTLQGYEAPPPQDRVRAHVDGWNRGVDLVLDLFRTGTWNVGHTTRTGNQIRSVDLRVAERK